MERMGTLLVDLPHADPIITPRAAFLQINLTRGTPRLEDSARLYGFGAVKSGVKIVRADRNTPGFMPGTSIRHAALRGLPDRLLRPVSIEDIQSDGRGEIPGTIHASPLVDDVDHLRHALMLGGGDLLDGAPKRFFKADAGLVSVDDDGSLGVLWVHDRLLKPPPRYARYTTYE
jgi:hypothetical protein